MGSLKIVIFRLIGLQVYTGEYVFSDLVNRCSAISFGRVLGDIIPTQYIVVQFY